MQRYHSIADSQIRKNRQRLGSTYVDAPPTNWRKQRPHDCGKKQCALCHFGKIFCDSPPQILDERRSREMLRDWYNDAGN